MMHLTAGDVFFLPAGWCHRVVTLGHSFTINRGYLTNDPQHNTNEPQHNTNEPQHNTDEPQHNANEKTPADATALY